MSPPHIEYRLLNYYRCPRCGTEWSDIWDCAADDDCPACGCRHVSPYRSDGLAPAASAPGLIRQPDGGADDPLDALMALIDEACAIVAQHPPGGSGTCKVIDRVMQGWRLAAGVACPPEDRSPYRLTVHEDRGTGQVYIEIARATDSNAWRLHAIVEISRGVPCLHIVTCSDNDERTLHVYADRGVLYVTADDPTEPPVAAKPCRFTDTRRNAFRLG